jgi:hypothetical protein
VSPKKYEKTAKLIDETIKKRLCKTLSESQKSYVLKQKHVAFSKLNTSLIFNPIDNLKQSGFDILDEKSSLKEEKLRKFNSENILSDSKENQLEIINARKTPKTINFSMHLINQSLSKLNQKSASTLTIKDNNQSSINIYKKKKDSYDVINSYLKSFERLNNISNGFSSPLNSPSLNLDRSDQNSEIDLQTSPTTENVFFSYNDHLANTLKDDKKSTSSSSFNNNDLNQSFDEYNNNYISDDLWSGSSRLSYEKRTSSPSLKNSMRKFKKDLDTISLKETHISKGRRSHLKSSNGNAYAMNNLNSETETTIVTENEFKIKKQTSLKPLKNVEKFFINESCNSF